jgi:hypothetical protein
MINIVEQVNSLKEKAKEFLLTDGEVEPVVFAFLQNGNVMVCDMKFEDNEEKKAKFNALGELLKANGANACVTVFEAWYLPKEKIENQNEVIPPSEHPGREEAILVMGRTPDRIYSVCVPFSRNGKMIQFGEEVVGDTNDGHRVEDNLLKGLFVDVH